MKKLLLKIVCVIGLFCTSSAYAESYMQVATISLDMKDATIEDVFTAIEGQTEFTFFYDETELDSSKKIDLNVKNEKITKVLDKILDANSISYRITDRHIVLYKTRGEKTQKAENTNQQQGIVIKGIVTDENNEPLVGVTVVTASDNGTVTDLDGRFSLNAKQGEKVTFSYMGYESLTLEAKSVMKVSLKSALIGLEEVVVVGYGTLEKKQVTNSISSISAKELPVGVGGATITNALSGKVSNLVMQETPSPNSDTKLQMRGMASVNSSTGPLVVIDGMPVGDGGIQSIVQEDIASIDFLKDAGAAAIYGTRATGGVILITTKQASEGKMKVSYTGEAIFKNTFSKPRVMNAEEFLQYGGKKVTDGSYDWYDAALADKPVSQRHVLSLNGGSRDARIYVTTMYEDNRGVTYGDNRKDFSGRINGAFKVMNGWLDINTHVVFRQANRNKANAGMPIFANPTQSPYDGYPSESWPYTVSMTAARNSLYDAKNTTNKVVERWIRPDVQLKLNVLPIEGLSYNQTFGWENHQERGNLYEPSFLQRGEWVNRSGLGTAQLSYNATDLLNIDGYLSFVRNLNEDHYINASVGYSYFEKNYEEFSMRNYGFDFDPVGVWNMANGSYLNNPNISDPKPEMKSKKNIKERLFGIFGRVNYSFQDKYLAAATLRRDGSSKFAVNNRWGTFWQVSAAWRLSKENFLKDIEQIDDLKIRFAYGVTGNEGFDASYGAVTYTPSSNKTMLPDGSWVSSYATTRDINPNLGWEEKHEWNIGLDYELFNRRLWGKVDIYHRNVEGLIYETKNSKGEHGLWYENIGTLKGRGWELEIGGVIVQSKDWNYTSKINIGHNHTEVGTMDGSSNKIDKGDVGRAGATHRLEEGATVGSFLLYKYAGIENGNFVATLADGTKKVLDGGIDNNEKQYMGNYVPKAVIGWSHDVQYKNWSLQVQINSALGFDVYNAFEHVNGLQAGSAGTNNMLLDAYTKNAAITGPAQATDYFLEDGSYIKIQNISLGYRFNLNQYTDFIESAKLYFSVNNVCRLSKYSGLNPEIDFTGWEGGIDWGTEYPQTRTFALGVQLTF